MKLDKNNKLHCFLTGALLVIGIIACLALCSFYPLLVILPATALIVFVVRTLGTS